MGSTISTVTTFWYDEQVVHNSLLDCLAEEYRIMDVNTYENTSVVEIDHWNSKLFCGGTIPENLPQLFPSLKRLNISKNGITGTIPTSFSSLFNLEKLWLSSNKLTGTIPTEFSVLYNLQDLDLRDNQLTGTIPPGLSNLTYLRELYLSRNQLTGEIPVELASLEFLQKLNLSCNQLTGSIPSEFSKLLNLQVLDLFNNKLTGSIPASLSTLTNLQSLMLSNNGLSGELPAELCSLTSLQIINLSFNQLTGTIPESYSSLTNLHFLMLEKNAFAAPVPELLANFPQLKNKLKFKPRNYYNSQWKQILRSNFIQKVNNEDWEAIQIIESVPVPCQSNCLGVFKVHVKNQLLALKIVQHPVEDQEEAHYFHKLHRKEPELLIPIESYFPTFIPIVNYFTGDPLKLNYAPIKDKLENALAPELELPLMDYYFLFTPIYNETLPSFWRNLANFTVEEELYVLYQIVLTLDYLHTSQIVHGDLRSDNIWISTDPKSPENYLRLGVANFGLGNTSAEGGTALNDEEHFLSKFNQEYLPPELKSEEARSKWVSSLRAPDVEVTFWQLLQGLDSWSIAMSLLELYMCKSRDDVLFFYEDLQNAIGAGNNKVKEYFESLPSSVPPPVKRLAKYLLAVDPYDRDLEECLFFLGVELWIFPELANSPAFSGAEGWRSAPKADIEKGIAEIFQAVSAEIDEAVSKQSVNTWHNFCKLNWFAKMGSFMETKIPDYVHRPAI